MPSPEAIVSNAQVSTAAANQVDVRDAGQLAWLLGRDPKQRVRVRRTLVAGLIYLGGALFLAGGVHEGLVERTSAILLVAYESLGFGFFYLAIRSEFSLRCMDPSLTMLQIIHGLGAVVMSYSLIPGARSLTLPLLSLALTFALLSRLSPRQTMICGLSATAMLVLAFAHAYLLRAATVDVMQESINLIMAALSLPVFASVSRQVKEWRDRLDQQKDHLVKLIGDLRELATRDELTGVVNRRSINATMLEEYLRFKRHGRSFCLAMVDVDHFKRVNDDFGHYEGDRALMALATHAIKFVKRPDQVARWGGEEFLILMPECDLLQAQRTLEDMKATFSFLVGDGTASPRNVTFSVGLAQCLAGEALAGVQSRADSALYQAKAQGRNCICVAAL
ncbi:MAG: GGDEF domain-containing protein [Aquabacterium sp.]|uniref:diguanylate cyclase n=1 Tax=Aquabacterium sp. TaxID=1872578 RepID=UPI0025B993DC|nr:diguanylate cyclase [Aquabacterium sp.]MBI5925180.1 GGDEF domain-containing protein [Aquabacterium sp.]